MNKLKLFAQGTIIEIHDEDDQVIVSWMGFDDSFIPLKTHRQHAREIVTACNAYPKLIANIEAALFAIEPQRGNLSQNARQSLDNLRALLARLNAQ